MKITKHRKEIISIFESNNTKLFNAEDIFNIIGENKIDLSTIYRNVNALYDNSKLEKCIIDGTAYFYLSTNEHNHIAVCKKCHSFVFVGCLLHGALKEYENLQTFKVTEHDLTIYGICSSCA